jgi:hypothetical protein
MDIDGVGFPRYVKAPVAKAEDRESVSFEGTDYLPHLRFTSVVTW